MVDVVFAINTVDITAKTVQLYRQMKSREACIKYYEPVTATNEWRVIREFGPPDNCFLHIKCLVGHTFWRNRPIFEWVDSNELLVQVTHENTCESKKNDY